MPLLSFSVFRYELQTGRKHQTIRLPRKHPLKVGDHLFIYWKCRTKYTEKLGEGIIIDIKHLHLHEITGDLVTKDGFTCKRELDAFFIAQYGHRASFYLYDVITFDWTYKEDHSWYYTPEKCKCGTILVNGECPNNGENV